MSHDEFTKLYRYLQQEFAAVRQEIKTEVGRLGSKIDSVYGLLDNSIKQHETYEQEQTAIKSQLTRHDKWIHKLADKTEIKPSA